MAEASLVVLEEGHQAVGQLGREVALRGIAQDGHGTVVSADDDEALWLHCEDIKGLLPIVGIGRERQSGQCRLAGSIRVPKPYTQDLGAVDINGTGL